MRVSDLNGTYIVRQEFTKMKLHFWESWNKKEISQSLIKLFVLLMLSLTHHILWNDA